MVGKGKLKEKVFGGGDAYMPPFPGIPLLELAEMHRVMIENHGGVSAYSDTRISIRLHNGWYTVNGSDLSLTYMSKSQLVITGTIDSIFIERGV